MKQAEMAKWLKCLVLFTGCVGFVFMAVIVPELVGELARQNPAFTYLLQPGIIFIWVTAVPAYVSLYKVWQICCEINRNNSFCRKNASLLRDISRLSLLGSMLYLGMVFLMLIKGHLDIFVLLLIFGAIFLGVFVAVLTAALSHLTEKASALKQENDLTI
ncbi:MAG: DUF2975 domain-containing protein [Angelakisella sp.]